MIYLLRHGETRWNLAGRLQGQQDSPLTARGRRQAMALGGLLLELVDGVRPEAVPKAVPRTVVSSPLGRTRHTAEIVCGRLGLDPRSVGLEPRLAEIAFGAWEGLTRTQIDARDPDLWRRRLADKWNFVIPGGESYADVAARAGAWLAEQREDDTLLVVSHGCTGRILRGLYAGATPEEIFDMDEPQDALFRLTDSLVQRFDVDSA